MRTALVSMPVVLFLLIYIVKDPFKVIYTYSSYYTSGKPAYISLNRDYISTEVFIRNYPKQKYDSFIMGNSRSFFYSVNEWKKHITSQKCFHFNASAESLYGIYRKIILLKEEKVPIKNALLILDYATLKNVSNSKGHLFIKHPKLSKEGMISFQLEFLKTYFSPAFLKSYLLLTFFNIKSDLLGKYTWDYDSVSNEMNWSGFEKMIARNPAEYYCPRMSLFYKRDGVQKISEAVIFNEQKKMLQEIASVFLENQTKFRIIINPLYDQRKLKVNDVSILDSVFGKGNVFDYSGINPITSNIYNYYESSHYRPQVAKTIMEEIYKKND